MAPLRSTQARTRPHRSPMKKPDTYDDQILRSDVQLDSDDEPPTKRLRTSRKGQQKTRWIPGGAGGGGRRIELGEGEVPPVTPRSREPDQFRAPRSRRRETTGRRTNTTSRFSTRRRNPTVGRPRYTTAAAAAAATHSDGYKPREERGWEEYHPDLDLESAFAIIPSEEVDGIIRPRPDPEDTADEPSIIKTSPGSLTPTRRKPGRPQRTHSSMLQSLLTPEAPKFVPAPGPNPRERLTLPKPSYRSLDPFLSYETKEISSENYVNQTMANVGYQESEFFARPERNMIRQTEGSADEDLDLMPDLVSGEGNSAIGGGGVGRVEYDMDEQDVKWLDALNKARVDDGVQPIKPAIFEITMTKVEKEWHALEKRIPKPNPKAPQTQRPRSSSAAAVNGEPMPGEEPDSKCAICDDGDCENANAIVFCDGCDLAVHQECYGVPYIPEGQWLCRKCQLVGNARPSCIFCPNEGGAFKQTNNSKWAHLLCATWIPEVTIGNPSLMEPITDVEKVPNSRWKLGCYICKQDMGASIQCSDGRCYEPFHLTCARQAGLYLKMKTGGGQNSLVDSSLLRAYCHKHSPQDWKADHRTDRAFERAKKYFAHHFKGQIWADSKASALAISDQQGLYGPEPGTQKITLTNKKGQKPKAVWRLPSGAPVIPETILKTIEEALVRFTVPKKKEYVAEVCKYWTLKREARRGAALLKRLQLQMDTFNSFEVTRRDYKAQGAAGRARLERRISFAETLLQDLQRLREICALVKEREKLKLDDSGHLKTIIETVYFPIPPLLTPILVKALNLDRKLIYHDALIRLQSQVLDRQYITVNAFFTDLAKVFEQDIGFDASDQSNQQALFERPQKNLDDAEQRERRTLARRILRETYPLLQDALKQESALNGRPFEQQMKEMDDLLFLRRDSFVQALDTSMQPDVNGSTEATNGADVPMEKNELADIPMDSIEVHIETNGTHDSTGLEGATATVIQKSSVNNASMKRLADNTPPVSTNGGNKHDLGAVAGPENGAKTVEPPTPPMSTKGPNQNALTHGGIPWYVEQFDPEGTTIYEERWTGKDAMRDLSEELSDMDEEELENLGVEDTLEDLTSITPHPNGNTKVNGSSVPKKRKKGGNNWSDSSFRTRRRR